MQQIKAAFAQIKTTFQTNLAQRPSSSFMTLYIGIMLTVFPLFLKDYTDITLKKFLFVTAVTAAMVFILIAFPDRAAQDQLIHPQPKKWDLVLILFFVYFGVCVLSVISSPYFKLDWDAVVQLLMGYGRYDGIIVFVLLSAIFLAACKYGRLRMWHLVGMSIAMIIMAVISILQLCGYNVFDFYSTGQTVLHFASFIGTAGNVDINASLLCLLIPLCAAGYIFLRPHVFLSWLFLIGTTGCLYVMLQTGVSAGRLGLVAAALVFIPIILSSKMLLYRGLDIFITFFVAYFFKASLRHSWDPAPKTEFTFTTAAAVCLIIIGLLLAAKLVLWAWFSRQDKTQIHYHKKVMLCVFIVELVLVIAAAVYLRWGYTVSKNDTLLDEIARFFKGELDIWSGSHRIAMWQSAWLIFEKYPVLGSGYGSFRIAFDDIASPTYQSMIGRVTTVDFAHNDYLHILCSTGVLGLSSYLAFLGAAAVRAAKAMFHNPKIPVLCCALVCYLAQIFFSFPIVIVSPLFWLILGMLCYEAKNTIKTVAAADSIML